MKQYFSFVPLGELRGDIILILYFSVLCVSIDWRKVHEKEESEWECKPHIRCFSPFKWFRAVSMYDIYKRGREVYVLDFEPIKEKGSSL